ncbi:hypothetical protein BDW74DRAFT_147510 [Aspergillus multicolor]|uniref:uncharacterized protein n=1 Tax=Aspergillus multicolor TaxID=41759 RepID=UPI003CCE1BC6
MGPVLMPINNEKYKHAPWELFKDIDYSKAARDAQRIPAGSKVLYVLVGMYVLPEGRGVGNGRRLLEAAIEAVKEEASGKSVKAAVVVLVACGNKKAKRLYERVEFVPWEETVDIEGEKHWPMSLDITS